jgi:hypothetical protein
MLSAAEIASMTATVASSLDVSVVVKRNGSTPSNDGYGHTTENLATVGTYAINARTPSASILQTYAAIIGAQQSYMIRFMATSDIREGDIVIFNSINWKVHSIQKADSYTFCNDALIVSVQ